MAISQTTITGPIYNPDGQKPLNAKIVFELSSWDKEDGEAVFVTGPYVGDIDESGNFSVNLFTTTEGTKHVVYRVSVNYLNSLGKYVREFLGSVALSGEGPYKLADLTFVDPVSITTSFDLYAEIVTYALEMSETRDISQAVKDEVLELRDEVQNLVDSIGGYSLPSPSSPLAITSGGTGANSLSGAKAALGIGTLASQASNNINITGGSATDLTTLSATNAAVTGNTILGETASIMEGQGINATYKTTIVGAYCPLTFERIAATSGTGVMLEAKVKRGATSPSLNSDTGLHLASSFGDENGVLRPATRLRHLVDGTVGADFVPGLTEVLVTNQSGLMYTHTRFRSNGATEHAYEGTGGLRSTVGFTRAKADLTGATGVINKSMNISSFSRSGVGVYSCNLAITLPNTNYIVHIAPVISSGTGGAAYTAVIKNRTTTSFTFETASTNYGASSRIDFDRILIRVED